MNSHSQSSVQVVYEERGMEEVLLDDNDVMIVWSWEGGAGPCSVHHGI